jgi:hypothetical protein
MATGAATAGSSSSSNLVGRGLLLQQRARQVEAVLVGQELLLVEHGASRGMGQLLLLVVKLGVHRPSSRSSSSSKRKAKQQLLALHGVQRRSSRRQRVRLCMVPSTALWTLLVRRLSMSPTLMAGRHAAAIVCNSTADEQYNPCNPNRVEDLIAGRHATAQQLVGSSTAVDRQGLGRSGGNSGQ